MYTSVVVILEVLTDTCCDVPTVLIALVEVSILHQSSYICRIIVRSTLEECFDQIVANLLFYLSYTCLDFFV